LWVGKAEGGIVGGRVLDRWHSDASLLQPQAAVALGFPPPLRMQPFAAISPNALALRIVTLEIQLTGVHICTYNWRRRL